MKVSHLFPTGSYLQEIEETFEWKISGTRVAIFFFRENFNDLKKIKEDFDEIRNSPESKQLEKLKLMQEALGKFLINDVAGGPMKYLLKFFPREKGVHELNRHNEQFVELLQLFCSIEEFLKMLQLCINIIKEPAYIGKGILEGE